MVAFTYGWAGSTDRETKVRVCVGCGVGFGGHGLPQLQAEGDAHFSES